MQQPGSQCFGKPFGGVGTQLIQRREGLAAEIVSGFAVGTEDEFDEMGVGVDRSVSLRQVESRGLQDAAIGRVRLRPGAGRADHCPAISQFSQQSGPVGAVHVWDEQHDDGFGGLDAGQIIAELQVWIARIGTPARGSAPTEARPR